LAKVAPFHSWPGKETQLLEETVLASTAALGDIEPRRNCAQTKIARIHYRDGSTNLMSGKPLRANYKCTFMSGKPLYTQTEWP